jgi:putative transcriptional regulator
MNKRDTITRIFPDGRRTKTFSDGRVEDLVPIDPPQLTDEPDPADRVWTPEQLAKIKVKPRSITLRRALGLTQEEFAQRYRIPLGTLRDWEQGRSEPDAPARALLRVIAKNPEMVRVALAS